MSETGVVHVIDDDASLRGALSSLFRSVGLDARLYGAAAEFLKAPPGDDDQIVPIVASAMKSSKILENATLKVIKGGAHGYAATHADEFNAHLYAFFKGKDLE